jgi:ABC-type polysaccharide/polyol phosphate transport system ATPase subunit
MAPGSLAFEDVSLCYRLAKQRIPSFKDYALHWMRGALAYEQLWALRGLTFSIEPGERVGIVGRNGAGKSTLLKVAARVLKPHQGRARVEGRVAPILELGTGFDFELTGLENIYLNALLMGRTRREIAAQVDAIVDFSGLGDFVISPVRNYSSGMLARLGFSIVTAWRPDILILDEFLAVGDAAFLRKCQARLEVFWEAGTTLLLVSHVAEAVRANCRRCLWIEHGRLRADGPTADVLERYLSAEDEGQIRPQHD